MRKTAKKQAVITPIKVVMSLLVLGVSALTTLPKLVDSTPDGQMASAKNTVVVASGDVAYLK
ncbi:MAG: hypothetical protein WCD45_04540 [Gallionella sp.]